MTLVRMSFTAVSDILKIGLDSPEVTQMMQFLATLLITLGMTMTMKRKRQPAPPRG